MSEDRDWGGLGKILAEAKAIEAAERARPLVDCPLCGTPLQIGPRGTDCPMGHFSTPPNPMRADWDGAR